MTGQKALARGAAAALVIAAAAACGRDAATAPGIAPVEVCATKQSAYVATADTVTASMVYHPAKGLKMKIGEQHMLYVHSYAVCDTATSGYGPQTWETPCQPHKGQITVTAKAWIDSAGHPFVTFTPDLRFSPKDKWASWIALSDRFAAKDTSSVILYCPTDGSACIDESLNDAELVTQRNRKDGYLYRRVKHLSGYNIVSGYTRPDAME